MNIFRAYRFRMYPTEKQMIQINKTFGCTRYVYNHFLEEKKKEYEMTGKSKSAYGMNKELTILRKEYDWLKEIDVCALQASVFAVDDAFKGFYNGKGYPRFKCKGKHDSYKINNVKNIYKSKSYESIRLDLKNKVITLPKLKDVKIRGYRNEKYILGDIKSATIAKEANRYYVSVLVEERIYAPTITPSSIVGMDLGIKDMIVTSNNEKIKNTINIKEKRLKGLQKYLSRKVKGSKNYNKIKIKIQRLYLKIKTARKHLIHDITNKLIEENDIIVTENLDVKSMYQEHNIAKHLNKNPLGEIIRVLKYKSLWKGKKVIQIDKYYPSSQICNICDYKNKEVKDLSVRNWECPRCHRVHDRDINASINIMFEGVKLYMRELEQA